MMNDEIKQYFKPGKKNIIFVYLMYLSEIIIPLLPLIGAYFAYSNMSNKSKIFASHYTFAFRTFCVAIVGKFIAILTTFILIGPVISFLLFIWVVARSIIALKYLMEDSQHPNPLTFWIK